jgi:hypothetical protein
MGFAVLTLFVALAISAVAAWYSIVGLMAIFAAAAIPIAIMGSVLEVGKLLTASWLYQNWTKIPFLLKSYLTTAVVVLMFITSMGIFGFLSKAHLDQTLMTEGSNDLLIQNLERQISQQRRIITNGETLLGQLDKTVEVLIEYDRIRGPEGALAVRKGQAEQRDELNSSIQSSVGVINELNEKLLPLQKERVALEAEVGPLKYIAELIYGNEAENMLDEAVRLVILLLIFVFDPLAVLLVIAGNMSLREAMGKPRKMVEVYNWKTDENVETEINDDDDTTHSGLPETDPEGEEEFKKTFGKNSSYEKNKVFHGIKKKT